MTRAMDTLILTRAVYRRRYGTDCPKPVFRRGFSKSSGGIGGRPGNAEKRLV